MTQHKEMIDEARRLLNTERENTPSMMRNFSDPEESWLLTHPCGKVIKTFNSEPLIKPGAKANQPSLF